MSSQQLAAPVAIAPTDLGRELLVIWQDPETRLFHPMGTLAVKEEGFAFRYHESAARHLAAIPDNVTEYLGHNLPAFFANRVLDPRQPAFPDYLRAFDLSEPVSPVELLVRSAGRRVTDTFQIVEIPQFDDTGRSRQHFFVSGVRHIGEPEALGSIKQGERLRVLPEPTNPINPAALRLLCDVGTVGFVPDWQLPLLRQVVAVGGEFSIHVVRVNPPDQGAHLRVLASLDIQVPPGSQVSADYLFENQGPANVAQT